MGMETRAENIRRTERLALTARLVEHLEYRVGRDLPVGWTVEADPRWGAAFLGWEVATFVGGGIRTHEQKWWVRADAEAQITEVSDRVASILRVRCRDLRYTGAAYGAPSVSWRLMATVVLELS